MLYGEPRLLGEFPHHQRYHLGVDAVLLHCTYEFWHRHHRGLGALAEELQLRVVAHVWPAFFPSFSYGQSFGYYHCLMHKVSRLIDR